MDGRAICEALEERKLLAWGAVPQLIDQDLAQQRFPRINGVGQAVAVIDSGVDYNHPALGGGWGRVVVGGYDFVRGDADPMDETGHGTQVAGIIAARSFNYGGRQYKGIASGAKIVALRVSDNSVELPDSRVERALKWVIRNRTRYNITAVNLSFGDGNYTTKTSRWPYGDELRKLARKGVFVGAASGNEGISSPGINYPAADVNVTGVGSVNPQDVISKFTKRDGDLDLLAPGEDVPTTFYDIRRRSHTYLASTGTSFSSPFAVGAAMLVRQLAPNLSPAKIRTILRNTGRPNFDGDRERPATYRTYRRLDLDDALNKARSKGRSARSRLSGLRAAGASPEHAPTTLSSASPFNDGTTIASVLGVEDGSCL